jgi:hypothetical protein
MPILFNGTGPKSNLSHACFGVIFPLHSHNLCLPVLLYRSATFIENNILELHIFATMFSNYYDLINSQSTIKFNLAGITLLNNLIKEL